MDTTQGAPTPRDVATGRPVAPFTVAPALTRQAPLAARRPAAAPLYDRRTWEAAVQASGMHFTARLIALTLAHHAGADGFLPAGGIQHSGRMRECTGLSQERVRQCLRDLEKAGFISRPPSDGWEPRHQPRPITLTLPSASAGTEPPHTGAAS